MVFLVSLCLCVRPKRTSSGRSANAVGEKRTWWAAQHWHAAERRGRARRERQAGWPCRAACPSAACLSGRLSAVGWCTTPSNHGNAATCLMLRCARPGEKVTGARAASGWQVIRLKVDRLLVRSGAQIVHRTVWQCKLRWQAARLCQGRAPRSPHHLRYPRKLPSQHSTLSSRKVGIFSWEFPERADKTAFFDCAAKKPLLRSECSGRIENRWQRTDLLVRLRGVC